MSTPPQLFLLSPAYCGGRRAGYLLRPHSTLPLAVRLRTGTLTLGEAFSFMSGLYFRGKLAYAQHFGTHANPLLVITPTRGLQTPDVLIDSETLREFATQDVDIDAARYHQPLVTSLRELSTTLSASARVILLGSLATTKYVEPLFAAVGDRLHYPTTFVGRGDMSRGGLLLRAVASGKELDYEPLSPTSKRHGARPPKLTPLARTQRPG